MGNKEILIFWMGAMLSCLCLSGLLWMDAMGKTMCPPESRGFQLVYCAVFFFPVKPLFAVHLVLLFTHFYADTKRRQEDDILDRMKDVESEAIEN